MAAALATPPPPSVAAAAAEAAAELLDGLPAPPEDMEVPNSTVADPQASQILRMLDARQRRLSAHRQRSRSRSMERAGSVASRLEKQSIHVPPSASTVPLQPQAVPVLVRARMHVLARRGALRPAVSTGRCPAALTSQAGKPCRVERGSWC